jgi:hypothetical protein
VPELPKDDEDSEPDEYDHFEELARKLLAVPKGEVDELHKTGARDS